MTAEPELHRRKVQQCPALRRAQAIEQFRKVGAQLELREFPDGALVVQTLSHSDTVVRALPRLPAHSSLQVKRCTGYWLRSDRQWPGWPLH